MNADEVIDAAMSRCTDLGANVPAARSVYYRRIAIRQAEIFSMVAATHPEYFGTSQTVALSSGTYALAGLNPKAERVTDVVVANPGTSGLQTDDQVNLIIQEDWKAQLAPRAVIRDQILRGIKNDLTGVATVTIYYSRRPTATAATMTKTTEMELPEQFQDLLVIDVAKQMIRKLLDVEPSRRDGWLDLLGGEEKALLATLSQHVSNFVHAEQNRFRPPSSPAPGSDTA